ncbi:uncharacterized protein LOC130649500 [Hydractinia symbiolongicarpus]|uniref:uncharacterized protein LOC130649500 n=1 Tax=Hydractinia symbiolongicarpus TaxID=13093 RepID=UPI00254E63C5|nr:uncharacterized protein LOC130649500 [Hydractinia symbiolongicarpus]
MKAKLLLFILLLVLTTLHGIASKVLQNEVISSHHNRIKRAVNATVADSTNDESGCGKTCVMIVVGCVLAVLLLCLAGSIYYAACQDKGQTKHQEDWNRTLRNAENKPVRQPISLRQMDDQLNQFGMMGSSNVGFMDDSASMVGSELPYDPDPFYHDEIYQQKLRNFYLDQGWDQDELNYDNPQRRTRFGPPVRRNRIFSAPDIYEGRYPGLEQTGRAFSLDQNMYNQEDSGGYYEPQADYPVASEAFGSGGYIEGNSKRNFDNTRPVSGPPQQFVDYYGDILDRQYVPNNEPMIRKLDDKRLIRDGNPPLLKSAMKNSRSCQSIPIEVEEEFENDVRRLKPNYNRSKSFDDTLVRNKQDTGRNRNEKNPSPESSEVDADYDAGEVSPYLSYDNEEEDYDEELNEPINGKLAYPDRIVRVRKDNHVEIIQNGDEDEETDNIKNVHTTRVLDNVTDKPLDTVRVTDDTSDIDNVESEGTIHIVDENENNEIVKPIRAIRISDKRTTKDTFYRSKALLGPSFESKIIPKVL